MSKQGQGESKRSWNIISIALYDVLYLIPPDDTLVAFFKDFMPAWDIQKVCYDVSQVLCKNPELIQKSAAKYFICSAVGPLWLSFDSNYKRTSAVSGLPLQQYQSSHWISELLHNPSTSLTHHIVILYHTISKVSSFKEHLNLLFSWVHVQCKSVRA